MLCRISAHSKRYTKYEKGSKCNRTGLLRVQIITNEEKATEEVRYAARDYWDPGNHHPGYHNPTVPLARSVGAVPSNERRNWWSRRFVDKTKVGGRRASPSGDQRESLTSQAVTSTRMPRSVWFVTSVSTRRRPPALDLPGAEVVEGRTREKGESSGQKEKQPGRQE